MVIRQMHAECMHLSDRFMDQTDRFMDLSGRTLLASDVCNSSLPRIACVNKRAFAQNSTGLYRVVRVEPVQFDYG